MADLVAEGVPEDPLRYLQNLGAHVPTLESSWQVFPETVGLAVATAAIEEAHYPVSPWVLAHMAQETEQPGLWQPNVMVSRRIESDQGDQIVQIAPFPADPRRERVPAMDRPVTALYVTVSATRHLLIPGEMWDRELEAKLPIASVLRGEEGRVSPDWYLFGTQEGLHSPGRPLKAALRARRRAFARLGEALHLALTEGEDVEPERG